MLMIAVVSFFELPSKRMSPIIEYSYWNAKFTRIFLGMLYVAALSIGIGTNAFQQPLIFNDFMILFGMVRYWLILQVGQWTVRSTERRTFFWVLIASLGLSALVGVLQYFNLLGVNYWLTPHYALGSQAHGGLDLVKRGIGMGRVVGTHGDPRHYGYILVVGMALCLASLAHLRHRGFRVLVIIVLVLCLMSAVFTASRTVVLSGIAVMITSVILSHRGQNRTKITLGLLIVFVVVGVWIIPRIDSTAFERRVLDVESVSFERSFNARIRDLVRPFDYALDRPIIWLIGRGPSKAVIRTNSHNDFGWYFYRFGLPGLILYLLLIANVAKIGFDAYQVTSFPLERSISTAVTLLSINWFIYAMAENIFKQPQLMALNMWLVGAAIGITRAEQQNESA